MGQIEEKNARFLHTEKNTVFFRKTPHFSAQTGTDGQLKMKTKECNRMQRKGVFKGFCKTGDGEIRTHD